MSTQAKYAAVCCSGCHRLVGVDLAEHYGPLRQCVPGVHSRQPAPDDRRLADTANAFSTPAVEICGGSEMLGVVTMMEDKA